MKHKKPMQVKTASPRTNMIQYVYHKGVAGTTSPRSFGGRKQLQKRRGGGGSGGSGGKKNNSQTTTASKTTVLSGLTLCVLFGEEEKTIPPLLTMCVPKRPTTSSGIEKSSRGYSSNWVKMTQRGGGHGSSRFRQHAHGEDKHMIERGIDRLTSVVVKQSSVVKGSGKKHYGGGSGGLNTTR